MNIPAGYQLHITSWENDGDDYKTTILSGLSEPDARFYVDLATRFSSVNNWKTPGLGNEEIDAEGLTELMIEVLHVHPDISDTLRDAWLPATRFSSVEPYDFPKMYRQLCKNVLSNPVQYEGYFCRVVETIEVYYYETPVVNVTIPFLTKATNGQ